MDQVEGEMETVTRIAWNDNVKRTELMLSRKGFIGNLEWRPSSRLLF